MAIVLIYNYRFQKLSVMIDKKVSDVLWYKSLVTDAPIANCMQVVEVDRNRNFDQNNGKLEICNKKNAQIRQHAQLLSTGCPVCLWPQKI